MSLCTRIKQASLSKTCPDGDRFSGALAPGGSPLATGHPRSGIFDSGRTDIVASMFGRSVARQRASVARQRVKFVVVSTEVRHEAMDSKQVQYRTFPYKFDSLGSAGTHGDVGAL